MSKVKSQNSKLTTEEVRHTAKLAQLTLTDLEIEKFTTQLSEVLDYIGKLNEVETTGVEPTSQVTGLENVFREDKTKPCLSQEEALSGAKDKEDGYFKTKAVFE